MKNLLLTIEFPEEGVDREVLVRGDHSQSRDDMIQHARHHLLEFLSPGQLDVEQIEHRFILDDEADDKQHDVYLTLQMNRRTDHSYATGYYGEFWESDNTPANGPVGYTDKKTVQ